jgi:hypothetical protein
MKFTVLYFLTILAVASAWGQLGETPEQCDQRFGSVLSHSNGNTGWSLENVYRTNSLTITVRFITLSTGSRIAGWVRYTSLDTHAGQSLREPLLKSFPGTWEQVVEARLPREADEHARMITAAHNQHVAEMQTTIRKATGNCTKYWMSPTAFAGDDGTSLTLFSDVYRARQASTP